MRAERVDALLVGAAFAFVALLCLWFRFLPMVDLPQHHAMVSIMLHHDDPSFGFAERYTFDFLGRPYATVYFLAYALAQVMSLEAAMRIVVALCTLAPLAGAALFLRALGRPTHHVLLAVPFAFGAIWHWGFLNFLLGTGLLLACLGMVVRLARRRTLGGELTLGLVALVLLFTHVHGVFMLLFFAPVVAWAYRREEQRWWQAIRTLVPLAPVALATAVFVLATWANAEGSWARINPGLGERLRRFPEFLAAGLRDPWPLTLTVALLAACALALLLLLHAGGAWRSRRERAALGAMLAAQIGFYLFLPLNTNTATFVSARHALHIVLFALPLLPALPAWRGLLTRTASAAVAVVALVVVARHLACFDREARDFGPVLATMRPNQRVIPLIHDKQGRCVHRSTFPYLHFAGYYQARHGGDLARSFAVVWNVPIRYRDDFPRPYKMRDEIEWQPGLFSPVDLPHFDYVLIRRPGRLNLPPDAGLEIVKTSGPWTLVHNPNARPPVFAKQPR